MGIIKTVFVVAMLLLVFWLGAQAGYQVGVVQAKMDPGNLIKAVLPGGLGTTAGCPAPEIIWVAGSPGALPICVPEGVVPLSTYAPYQWSNGKWYIAVRQAEASELFQEKAKNFFDTLKSLWPFK